MSGRMVVTLLLAITTALIVVPIGVLAVGSFLTEPPRAFHFDWAGLTLHNYVEVFASPGFDRMLALTLGAALVGTFGAMVIGVSLSWLAVRTDVPGRPVLNAIAIMPMFVPPLVGAFAWDILSSPRSGIINVLLRGANIPLVVNIYTVPGIAFVFSIYYAPYVYLLVSSALRNMDPVLEEAAALSGAGRLRTAVEITLPLVLPALMSSGLMVFVLLVQVFAIPVVLGEPGNIQFISQRIWAMVGFSPPKINVASALGMLLLLLTVVLVLLQQRVLSRRSYVTVAGKGLRPKVVDLGAARWPLAILGYAYLLLVVLLPYAALLFIALRRNLFFSTVTQMFDLRQFNLAQFETVLEDPLVQLSLRNSMLVASGTVALGCTLYFAIAYVVHRTRLPWRKMLSVIATMPIAIPGIILGLGYLWSWISIPVGISGTLWIIILSYVAQFTPQGVYAISAALIQIHPELEEGSRLCGAGLLETLRRIVLPLAWPGLLSAIILLVVMSFRELATALFLYTTQTVVFSLSMFDDWVRGATGLVAVMALVQSVIVLAVVVSGQMVRRKQIDPAVQGGT
jgi:iron(III) transport system permease protein